MTTTEFIDAAEKDEADSFWADLNFVRDSLEDLESRCDTYPDTVRTALQALLVDTDDLLQDVDRFDGMVEVLSKKDDTPSAQVSTSCVSNASMEDESWGGEYYYCAAPPKDDTHEREFYPAPAHSTRPRIAISGA